MDYFTDTDLASDRFEGTEINDDRLIIQLLIDQVEFANIILMNKVDLCTKEHIEKVKNIIKTLNKHAKIIETKNSVVDLNEVVNTKKFDFEEMEMQQKGLSKELQEKKEYRHPDDIITSFVYQRNRPFNPHRLYNFLKSSFMIEVVLPPSEEEVNEEQGEDDDEEMDDDKYAEVIAVAKTKYKKDRDDAAERKKTTVLKDVVRSKGFLWLSNNPELFFEWQQAAISGLY